jgi:hypothetical protein
MPYELLPLKTCAAAAAVTLLLLILHRGVLAVLCSPFGTMDNTAVQKQMEYQLIQKMTLQS